MGKLLTSLDPKSAAFLAARKKALASLGRIRQLEAAVRAHGDRAAARFHARGALLPRDRVGRLLDPGRSFVELSTLAGYRMHDDDGERGIAGGGNICGVGVIGGVRCMVIAHDAAIKGGTISPMGLKKSLRAQQIALENRLPTVMLVESGGANLHYQSEIFVDGGQVFCNMARMSAAGLPQITVVHGSSTAGGAYLPGLSDYVIAVRDAARIFLAGPPLVKAALGEEAEEEQLGGAAMHASITGSVEYLAESDAHAIELARELVQGLSWPRVVDSDAFEEPLYPAEELLGIVPVNEREPFDVKEVIARLVDGSRFLELKPGFGADTVCGHASIEGVAVGIVGNNAPIMPEGSAKAAHFIQLCNQARLPLVYLMNTTGYMVGVGAEQGGAIKHGSKMIQAVANADVPQLTIVLGGAYGAGYYGMCGRPLEPRFIFSWPSARVAVMGGAQAGDVLETIARAKAEAAGKAFDAAQVGATRDAVQTRLDEEADVLFATARIWDDGVIDPRHTRQVLGACLRVCVEAERAPKGGASTFGVGRF